MSLTPERCKFHEILGKFYSYLPNDKDTLIYDVGVSNSHNYKEYFKEYDYRTLDCDKSKNPDILIDLEGRFAIFEADAIICMGVTEQCENPYNLIDGVTTALMRGGIALFGIISVGYPVYDNDRVRFTPSGVDHLLKDYEVLERDIFCRSHDIPSYVFVIGRKK